MTSKSGFDFEVMAAGFMLGSAIFQGVMEGSLEGSLDICILFLIPSTLLVILQWRRLVYLPMKEWKAKKNALLRKKWISESGLIPGV